MDKITISGNSKGVHLDVSPTCDIQMLRINSVGDGNKITIGDNVQLNAYIFVAHGAQVHIGASTKMMGQLTIHAHEGGRVDIGAGCLFANGVIIRPSDAHQIFDLGSNLRINPAERIIIGDHVWVCEHTSILKGSIVPTGSVIATRSVVTRKFVDENSIIGGVPAKVIRTGIRWEP